MLRPQQAHSHGAVWKPFNDVEAHGAQAKHRFAHWLRNSFPSDQVWQLEGSGDEPSETIQFFLMDELKTVFFVIGILDVGR